MHHVFMHHVWCYTSCAWREKYPLWYDKIDLYTMSKQVETPLLCDTSYVMSHETYTHMRARAHTHTHTHTQCRICITSSSLGRTATHCITLHHTATRCNTLQHAATHCNTLQRTATRCNTQQKIAAHCHTLQHTAAHCHTQQHNARTVWHVTRQSSRTHTAQGVSS